MRQRPPLLPVQDRGEGVPGEMRGPGATVERNGQVVTILLTPAG